jgi:hypothetical protein
VKNLERRTFLKSVVVGAAATLNFLYPGAVRAAGSNARAGHTVGGQGNNVTLTPAANGGVVKQVDGIDPTFAGGEVVSKTPDGVILQSAVGLRAIRIPAGTEVWKEFYTSPDVVELHDWVDVKGTPLSDESLQARSGWLMVNIGRRDGIVHQASPTKLTARVPGGTCDIELSPRLEVIDARDGTPLPGHIAELTPGTRFGAVGLRLPGNGFRATRIWKWTEA